MFAPGRKLPARPAKPGDTISFWRAVALQTSPKRDFDNLWRGHAPRLFTFQKKRRGVTASPQRVEKVRLPRPFPPKA